MFPPKGSGLERIIKNLENMPAPDFSRIFNLQEIRPGSFPEIPDPVKSIQSFFRNLSENISGSLQNISNSLQGLFKREPEVNYIEIIERFLPDETMLIKPDYPRGAKEYILADIDRDGRKELLFSYARPDNSVCTAILANRSSGWEKVSEITLPDCNSIHYRAISDLAGNGTYQLLLGMNSAESRKTLNGYMLSADDPVKLFGVDYEKLEVFSDIIPGNNDMRGTSIAIWRKDPEGSWDIELLQWNGFELEKTSKKRYYDKRVLPRCAMAVKQNPYNPENWYNLADFLAKAGYRDDAVQIINYGIKYDKNSRYTESFNRLKEKLRK